MMNTENNDSSLWERIGFDKKKETIVYRRDRLLPHRETSLYSIADTGLLFDALIEFQCSHAGPLGKAVGEMRDQFRPGSEAWDTDHDGDDVFCFTDEEIHLLFRAVRFVDSLPNRN